MSEYSERQSISKLIGSPPGYVGHDEGGTLTEAVRRRPHAVVLLDEIEKADKEILNILLQISDYGYLTDSSGRRVSFRNAIIIATSNLGHSRISESVGFENRATARGADPISALKKHYSEELINRFDEIILFNPLTDETLEKIVLNRLEELSFSLKSKGYTLIYDDAIAEEIVSSSKKAGLGARTILREISGEIEDKIINVLLSDAHSESILEIKSENGEITVSTKNAIKT